MLMTYRGIGLSILIEESMCMIMTNDITRICI